MTQDSEPHTPAFRTKTGICTITPDRLLLTRHGVRGGAATALVGSSMTRVLILHGAMAMALGMVAVLEFVRGNAAVGVVTACVSGLFFAGVYASRLNSAAPVIERCTICSVEAKAPRPPATRGYFVVWFEVAGKRRRRLIILPGILDRGSEEFARARDLFAKAGLLGK